MERRDISPLFGNLVARPCVGVAADSVTVGVVVGSSVPEVLVPAPLAGNHLGFRGVLPQQLLFGSYLRNGTKSN